MPPKVGVDHHLDELLEGDVWCPAERSLRLRCIGNQEVDLCRAKEPLVLHDELPIVEIDATEGNVTKLSHGPRAAGADDVIVRRGLLQHEPHRTDIVAGETPVAPCFQVTEPDLAR